MAEYTVHDRKRDRALAGLDLTGLRGVEIGPLDRPLVTRAMSEVYYVDHVSNDELVSKYAGDPTVNSANIPHVDFVWKDRPLLDMLGDKAPLDYIVASHVIEHVPDLIGWLTEMLNALRVGGRLILVIPDKRFTFDIFRRTSAFEEVQQAYEERRRRPGLRCIVDHFANVVEADAWSLWDDYSISRQFKFCVGPDRLVRVTNRFQEGHYIDVHCWVFTPWSFVDLLGRIVEASDLAFDLSHLMTTQSHDLEFYVQLTRVEASSTDWPSAARDAYSNALWPANGVDALQLDQAKNPTLT